MNHELSINLDNKHQECITKTIPNDEELQIMYFFYKMATSDFTSVDEETKNKCFVRSWTHLQQVVVMFLWTLDHIRPKHHWAQALCVLLFD